MSQKATHAIHATNEQTSVTIIIDFFSVIHCPPYSMFHELCLQKSCFARQLWDGVLTRGGIIIRGIQVCGVHSKQEFLSASNSKLLSTVHLPFLHCASAYLLFSTVQCAVCNVHPPLCSSWIHLPSCLLATNHLPIPTELIFCRRTQQPIKCGITATGFPDNQNPDKQTNKRSSHSNMIHN